MLQMQSRCLLDEILPGLAAAGVRIVAYSDLSEQRRSELGVYFEERVFPVLTPLSVGSQPSLSLHIEHQSESGHPADIRNR